MTQTLAHTMTHSLNGYSEEAAANKRIFHTVALQRLKALAQALGYESNEYDLRSNEAGMAVSGEVTLHTPTLYVQVSQSCMGQGNEILFRTCDGRKDYAGKQNHFAPANTLDDVEKFALYLNDCGRFGPFPAAR